MSTKALFWALEQRIPTNPKIVLIYLADWFNELEDCAWPSLEQLAERTGLSKSSVQRSITWLLDNRLVVVEHRFKAGWQKSNRFRLSIGVLCLQGSQSDHPSWSEGPPKGSQSDHPIEYTITDTIKDTINGGEPQEENSVKVLEAISGMRKEKAEIFKKAQRKDGKLTAGGCKSLWRDCAASAADDNGFQAEVLVKDKARLHKASIRIGEVFPEVVWKCMSNWIGFMKHAQSTAGAFPLPTQPDVGFFVKYIQAAADFTPAAKAKAAPVKSIANKPKPLTKATNKSKHTYSQPATAEEIKAIGEKHGL